MLLFLGAHIPFAAQAQQWVSNESRPATFKQGLAGKHIAVWASHGRYFDIKKGTWKWQRPNLFGTTEDLFSQTFTLPYVIPMLQNAGAVVWTPRERDWQTREVIVDNDQPGTGYTEFNRWKSTDDKGFTFHSGTYQDGENPFEAGTARKAKTTKKAKKMAAAIYQPYIPEEGDYAVYVSYQTLKKSTRQAEYIVRHQGIDTRFLVNQQMGGGTWVYLGTFHFDKGRSERNSVLVSNVSSDKGIVTTDAVRFGGGIGNIERGGSTSGLPRFAEGARYWAQWAGAPRKVVSLFNATNDYNDDINCRSLMENWLAGGSSVLPDSTGLGVPFDASLAMHTDAGVKKDNSHYGTLTIVTTDYQGRTTLGNGRSRQLSKTLAESILSQVCADVEQTYGLSWPNRTVWDKNYNECRRPEVPSCIIEMLSHQNFADMREAHDPNFKFTLSRAIYKSVARFINPSAVIAPLAPSAFRLGLKDGKATLSWSATADPLEPTATPTSYIVYSATANGGFNNGTLVKQTSANLPLTPGVLQSYRIAAVNAGGESFPTEVLSAVSMPNAKKTVLVVNGFRRLSGPAVVDTDSLKGFDLDEDAGVSYIRTAGWAGRQTCFDATKIGGEGPGTLGYGGDELAGQIIAGNTFNYVRDHAEALRTAGAYNVVSCSAEAVENGLVRLSDYDAVDLILGLEKNDHHSLVNYKALTPAMQTALSDYAHQGGRLLVSGSYVGADMQQTDDAAFLQDVLKTVWGGAEASATAATVSGMGLTLNIHTTLNEEHYAAQHPDVLTPAGGAFTALTYGDGRSAAVAYDGTDCKTFTMGFPWECVKDKATRQALMRGIISFLLK